MNHFVLEEKNQSIKGFNQSLSSGTVTTIFSVSYVTENSYSYYLWLRDEFQMDSQYEHESVYPELLLPVISANV